MGVRAAVAFALAALAGVWTSFALGQIPGVTVPTVTVPTVTVPTIPTVTVPVPLPLPDVTGPSTGTVKGTVKGTVQATGTALGGVTGQGTGSTEGKKRSRKQQRAQPSRRDPELRAHPRRFKNRPEPGEPYGTTFSFWIGRSARVTFFIRRESPNCVFIGTFRYSAHKGVNRVRWFGHWRGKRLAPGTYRITARARRGTTARSLGSVRVVIAPANRDSEDVDPQPSQCTEASRSPTGEFSAENGGTTGAAGARSGGSNEGAEEGVAGTTASSEPPPAGVNASGPIRDGRILGVVPNPFEEAPSWLQAFLLGALGAAILLLLLAAVPAPALRPTGAATFVARRRTDLALAGAMILAAVTVAALVL